VARFLPLSFPPVVSRTLFRRRPAAWRPQQRLPLGAVDEAGQFKPALVEGLRLGASVWYLRDLLSGNQLWTRPGWLGPRHGIHRISGKGLCEGRRYERIRPLAVSSTEPSAGNLPVASSS
jgi:hypothetical protein